MSYEIWSTLLGKSTLDPEIASALHNVGIRKPPVVARNDTSVCEEFNGIMIEFRAAHLVKGFCDDAGDGVGVLESVSMWLADEDELYEGPLPHGISRSDNRRNLQSRFGERFYEDDEMDQWRVEGRTLRAEYEEDGSLLSVHVILQTEDT